jgi:dsRNA-specific ribonuclease
MDAAYQQWAINLQSFIYDLLEPIIPDKEKRKKYVDEKTMPIWIRAFTHPSYNINTGQNFENLEFIGDKMLGLTFSKYIMDKFPNENEQGYTELNRAYMSAEIQGKLSRGLNLPSYLRVAVSKEKMSMNDVKDIFESFFGALMYTSDKVREGTGYINCFNMVVYLFKDININIDEVKGETKTQVQQIFKRFGFENPGETQFQPTKGVFVTDITLLAEHIEFLRLYGVDIANRVIGTGRGNTPSVSASIAYKNASETLASYGINSDWATQVKQNSDFDNPKIKAYLPVAEAKYKSQGYVRIYFYIRRKNMTQGAFTLQLIGIRPDNKEEVLLTINKSTSKETRTQDQEDAKVQAMEEYTRNP